MQKLEPCQTRSLMTTLTAGFHMDDMRRCPPMTAIMTDKAGICAGMSGMVCDRAPANARHARRRLLPVPCHACRANAPRTEGVAMGRYRQDVQRADGMPGLAPRRPKSAPLPWCKSDSPHHALCRKRQRRPPMARNASDPTIVTTIVPVEEPARHDSSIHAMRVKSKSNPSSVPQATTKAMRVASSSANATSNGTPRPTR